MAANNIPEHILELMTSYLSGNASDAAVRQLEEWVSADPTQKQAFIQFKKSWMLASLNSPTAIDVNQEWNEIARSISSEAKTIKLAPKNNRRNWLRIAAVGLLLIAAMTWLFKPSNHQPGTTDLMASQEPIENSLPDGTKVELNQFSNLSYSFDKSTSIRKVNLEGDAFFDVKRDESAPFFIHAGPALIQVLGTSFYVDARDESSTLQVIVRSGSVSVAVASQKVVLTGGQQAIFDRNSGELIAQENKDPNYRSFIQKSLTFNNTTLKEVVFAINRQYHVDLKIVDSILEDCELTASYNNKTLESLLAIIEATMNLNIEKSGDTYLIKGSGC